jgi:hypothetical protein
VRRGLAIALAAVVLACAAALRTEFRDALAAAGLTLAGVSALFLAGRLRADLHAARPALIRARAGRNSEPARAVHPAAPRLPDMCAGDCGRPAELEVAGELVCRLCAPPPAGSFTPLPLILPADDNRPAVPDPAFDDFAAHHQESQP